MNEKQQEAPEQRLAEIRRRNDSRKKFRNAGDATLVATTDDIDFLLSLLQQPAASERCGECENCHHSGPLNEEGRCTVYIGHLVDPEGPFHGQKECFCKCVYPATGVVDDPASFKEFLREQLKDPEFARAYKEVGEEVDSEVATTGAGEGASLVDKAQRRMDAVVEAAVQWHQSGKEGDGSGFDKAEALGDAVDRLLELRAPATVVEGRCDFCDHPSGFLPAELEGGQWIHRGRDNEAEVCAATPHKCTKCGEMKTSPECMNCSALGIAAIESEAKLAIANESRSSAPGPAAAPVVETAQDVKTSNGVVVRAGLKVRILSALADSVIANPALTTNGEVRVKNWGIRGGIVPVDPDDLVAFLPTWNSEQPSTPTPGEAARELALRIAEIHPPVVDGRWDGERSKVWVLQITGLLSRNFPPTDPTQRKYFCSCGAACTAEEYIEHYFEQGHDRGEGAQVAVEAVGDTYSAKRAAIEIADALRSADEGWRNKPTYHEFEAIISKHCSADAGEVERLRELLRDSCDTEDRCRALLKPYDKSDSSGVVPLDEITAIALAEVRAGTIRECANIAKSDVAHYEQVLSERNDGDRDILNYGDFIKGQRAGAHGVLDLLELLAKEGYDGPTSTRS